MLGSPDLGIVSHNLYLDGLDLPVSGNEGGEAVLVVEVLLDIGKT